MQAFVPSVNSKLEEPMSANCVMTIGDGHFSGLNPVGRLDNLVEVQYVKLNEIVDLCNQFNVPGILAGDLFNTSNASYMVYTSVSEVLLRLNNPWYVVWGNHDLLYHSMTQWKKTALGALLTSHPKVKHIREFVFDYGYRWSWHNWGEEITQVPGSDLLLSHQAVVVPAHIQASPWIGEDHEFAIQWTDPSLDPYRIIVCGHWHQRYFLGRGSKKLLNPGPILRRDVTADTINYMPSVTMLNLDNGLVQRYPIQSAQPGNLVLSRRHITDRPMTHNQHIVAFIEKVFAHRGDDHTKTGFMALFMQALNSGELDPALEQMLRGILSKVKENTHDAG
jgi:predicted phosphodiesterase